MDWDVTEQSGSHMGALAQRLKATDSPTHEKGAPDFRPELALIDLGN